MTEISQRGEKAVTTDLTTSETTTATTHRGYGQSYKTSLLNTQPQDRQADRERLGVETDRQTENLRQTGRERQTDIRVKQGETKTENQRAKNTVPLCFAQRLPMTFNMSASKAKVLVPTTVKSFSV